MPDIIHRKEVDPTGPIIPDHKSGKYTSLWGKYYCIECARTLNKKVKKNA